MICDIVAVEVSPWVDDLAEGADLTGWWRVYVHARVLARGGESRLVLVEDVV